MSSFKKSNYKTALTGGAVTTGGAVKAVSNQVSAASKKILTKTAVGKVLPKKTITTRLILPPCSSYLRAIKKTERDNFLRSSMFGSDYDAPLQVEETYYESNDDYEEDSYYTDEDE